MQTGENRYNATVTHIRRIHDDLLILWVRPDFGRLEYLPGQYAILGLGTWEPPVPCEESIDDPPRLLIRRAYSMSHTPVDEHGRLLRPGDSAELEFYISLVRQGKPGRPLLTPRLFLLEPGRRLFLHPQARGSYTLENVPQAANVLFAATGTGEAPHNAMVAQLLSAGHRGQLASIVCVRQRRDLPYAEAHRQLTKQFSNYRYLPLTTREPENLDSSSPGFVGKKYVQDILTSSAAEQTLGFPLTPQNCHVFLCGNPDMLGLVPTATATERPGAIATLQEAGFTIDTPVDPGNIHIERFF